MELKIEIDEVALSRSIESVLKGKAAGRLDRAIAEMVTKAIEERIQSIMEELMREHQFRDQVLEHAREAVTRALDGLAKQYVNYRFVTFIEEEGRKVQFVAKPD